MDYFRRMIRQIDEMDEKSQAAIYNHLIGKIAKTATEKSKEFEVEGMFERYDSIKKRYASWGMLIGQRTGYPSIDKMTMGLAPGEVTVIGGATSNGKTALSINIAANLAMQGKSVLFVTLEMTKDELGVRFMKVMGDKFEDGMVNVYMQKNDELSWQSVDGLMKKAKEDCKVDLVVIDHLHYFTRELKNVAEDLGNITKQFKKNAIRHELPVILISHTRKAADSHSTTTGINDLRGSSYIAQDADIVLMVERDQKYPENIYVTLAKNRNRYGTPIGTKAIMGFNATKITE